MTAESKTLSDIPTLGSEAPTPGFRELLSTFARVGCLSFGGPAGQIALMHRVVVDEKGWVEEERYLRALNLCHLLPGPEAQQLATWIGWRLHGTKGAIASGLLFIVPGALVMLALTLLYVSAAQLPPVAALLLGIKAAVVAIVAQAMLRIGGRALKGPAHRLLALAAFLGLAVFAIPFPLLILAALAIGWGLAAHRPDWLKLKPLPAPPPGPSPLPWRETAGTLLLWLALWALPMLLVLAALGPDHVLWRIGAFFSKLAVVTFGGAYAVLAYMAQQAVETQHWLSAGQMTDALGLAETTPGPLILVTQFVGFLAAWQAPAPFPPLVAGTLGALLTLWVTFAPCFLWILAFAPWMERLERSPRLAGALAAVTASVVGVIANLALWFTLHLLFRAHVPLALGPAKLDWPVPASLDVRALALTGLAAVLLLAMKRGIFTVLACTGLASLALSILT